jgi:ubiquinone/menaquinone biosynthesis C-methylase UbiE
MGHIFDLKSAKLYEEWLSSPGGVLLDKLSTDLIVRLVRPKRGERILDVGCGTGNHLLLFHKLGLDVTGIDASPYMLDMAKSRLGSKASLKISMADDLPFEDNEFDITTLIVTLEFIDNPLAVLKEVGRVTKDRVFVGVLNYLSFGCISKKIFSLFNDSIFRETHLFSLWGIREDVKKAYGNTPIEWGSVQTMPTFFFKEYTRRIEMSPLTQSYPFGTFIGISSKMMYTLRTEGIRIGEELKKGAESLVGSPGF